MPIVDATSAIDLPSYGDALVSSCESFIEAAVREIDVDVDDYTTAAGPAMDADVDAMTTRACVDACTCAPMRACVFWRGENCKPARTPCSETHRVSYTTTLGSRFRVGTGMQHLRSGSLR